MGYYDKFGRWVLIGTMAAVVDGDEPPLHYFRDARPIGTISIAASTMAQTTSRVTRLGFSMHGVTE